METQAQSTQSLYIGLRQLNKEQAQGGLNTRYSRLVAEEEADELLVKFFADQLRLHLQHYREQGKGGWWSNAECQQELLEQYFVDAAKVGNVVSAAAFAAMIHARVTCRNYGSYLELLSEQINKGV